MIKNIKRTTTFIAMLTALGSSGLVHATDVTAAMSPALVAPVAKVNINTADAASIEGKVKGIGQKRAEAIVSYRKEHGAYKSWDDLAQVKGIGESFVKMHRDALAQAFTLS